MLHSNQQTGLSSGTKFLDIGRTVLEKGVTVVLLEICLSEKALMELECNLEKVGNGGKSASLNSKETAIIHDFINAFNDFINPQCFCI